MTATLPAPPPAPLPASASAPPSDSRRTAQRGWSLYDVANSAFMTTLVATVAGPYLLALTNAAATLGPTGNKIVHVAGFAVAPGAFVAYLTTAAVILQVILLPVLGAVVDATGNKQRWITGAALTGATLTAILAVLPGSMWFAAGVTYALAVVAFGAALVPYNACLPDIADEAERDRVSARGFAYGYAGGGLLLAVNLAFLQLGPAALGISKDLAVRIDIASVAIWWAVFTLISMRILGKHLPEAASTSSVTSALRHSLTDLKASLEELLRYKQATRFLGAFILFGNGVQGVIGLAGVFIVHELFLANGQSEADGTPFVMVLVLVIQFCAVPGALLFARLADRIGTQRAIVTSLGLWIAVVTYAFALLDSKPQALGLAVAIAVVLGGTQSLSRSLFTKMIPSGREASWLSLYNLAERGTSGIATLTFGIALTLTGSYRAGLASLLILFVLGTAVLLLTDTDRAVAQAKTGLH